MATTVFDSASAGEVEAVSAFLRSGVDIEARNQYGFTALHCAASACNKADATEGLKVIRALLDAGASPNAVSKDGRSVLYLMAEMSWTLEPVKLLVESGADPNVTNSGGIHVVINALSKDVKQYLSQLTGYAVPPPRRTVSEVKLSTSEWRQVKTRLDKVFDELTRSGLVAIQDAGYTQEDGLSDCAEEFNRRGGVGAGLIGACYYTRQDLNRAKRTGLLLLAFLGGPDGGDGGTVSVGNRIVEILEAHDFVVDWTGTAGERPTVYLHESLKGSNAR